MHVLEPYKCSLELSYDEQGDNNCCQIVYSKVQCCGERSTCGSRSKLVFDVAIRGPYVWFTYLNI